MKMKQTLYTTILLIGFFLLGYFFFYWGNETVERVADTNHTSNSNFINSFPSESDSVYFGNMIRTVSAYDHLYLLDQQQNDVIKYDYDGNLVSRIGRSGMGPGELIMPLGISADESYLYVFEQNKMQVQKFDHSGEYQDVYLLNGSYEDILVNDSDIWLVNHFFQGMPDFTEMRGQRNQSIFTIFNRSDSTFHNAGEYPEIYDQLNWDKGGIILEKYENNIYTAFPRLPLIHVYNGLTKELEKVIQLKSETLDNQEQSISDGQSPEITFRDVPINDAGIFMPIFGDDMHIYHFDFNGELVDKYDFEDFYNREDSDNYIRHLDTEYNVDKNTIRLFTHIFSWENPRTVIVELNL